MKFKWSCPASYRSDSVQERQTLRKQTSDCSWQGSQDKNATGGLGLQQQPQIIPAATTLSIRSTPMTIWCSWQIYLTYLYQLCIWQFSSRQHFMYIWHHCWRISDGIYYQCIKYIYFMAHYNLGKSKLALLMLYSYFCSPTFGQTPNISQHWIPIYLQSSTSSSWNYWKTFFQIKAHRVQVMFASLWEANKMGYLKDDKTWTIVSVLNISNVWYCFILCFYHKKEQNHIAITAKTVFSSV